MVHATTPEEAESAYWELDNRVVVQGQLFESAAWTARIVSDAICNGEPSEFGLTSGLDLLVEIAAGEPDQSELAHGNKELGNLCRRELRQFLPCFRRFALSGVDRTLIGVMNLLDLLEIERERVRETAETIIRRGVSSAVEQRARELIGGD